MEVSGRYSGTRQGIGGHVFPANRAVGLCRWCPRVSARAQPAVPVSYPRWSVVNYRNKKRVQAVLNFFCVAVGGQVAWRLLTAGRGVARRIEGPASRDRAAPRLSRSRSARRSLAGAEREVDRRHAERERDRPRSCADPGGVRAVGDVPHARAVLRPGLRPRQRSHRRDAGRADHCPLFYPGVSVTA
jgi:hypothetical protein